MAKFHGTNRTFKLFFGFVNLKKICFDEYCSIVSSGLKSEKSVQFREAAIIENFSDGAAKKEPRRVKKNFKKHWFYYSHLHLLNVMELFFHS